MVLSIILIPLLGGVLLPVVCKRGVKPSWYGFTLGAVVLGIAAVLLYMSVHSGESSFFRALPLGLGFKVQLDMLSAFMALCASALSFIIIFYSTGYIHDEDYESEYYSVVLIFLGAMLGLVFSLNLVWIYVFWEITAVCSWRLVGFLRKDEDRKKAVKTFLVTMGGALFFMLGLAAVYFSNGSLDLTVLKGQNIPVTACFLLIIGMLSKSAILPFSTWLPDAGVAPSPVTALLHAAVLVKIGVYAFARIFYTVGLDPIVGDTVMYLAAVSTLIAGGAALIETNIKRIIAYSTISQLGFIFFALASGTAAGLVAGMLFILMHGAAKGGLFLCAGIIEHKAHTKDITKMGGLYKTLPVTMVCFALCALSVMGIPPLGGFFSKYLTFQSAMTSGSSLVVIFMFFLAACFTAAYLLRLFHKVFLAAPAGEQELLPAEKTQEGTPQMLISVAVLAGLSVLLGLCVGPLVNFLLNTCVQMGVI